MALKGPRTGSYTNAVTSRYNFNRLPTADFVLAQTPIGPDEYFKDTTLLLSTSSTNGAQNNTFLDSSTNNFTITRNGNATQGTYSPYSHTGWSNYFDGTGDFISAASNSAFQFGTGNFTVEFWLNTIDTTFNIVGLNTSGAGNWMAVILSGTFYWQDAYATTNLFSTSATGILDGRWHHVAITRLSGTTRVYFDGISQASASDSANYNGGGALVAGAGANGDLIGYISNLRVVKGSAVYTSAFTPPTSPLTAIANTSLLTCQSNRFIDNSANNFTVTRNGDVSIQPFEPFAPGVEYSANTVGGSLYLDGSGDYLTVPDNSSYGYGTGDFTIEFWMYPNSVGLQTVVSNLTSASSTNPHLYISSSIRYYTANADRITGASLVTGQWYHIALCRNSGSTRLFVNGTQSGSTYSDTNNYGSSAPLGIGTYWNGASPVNENIFNGYISNLRILKGTGLYTGNFTPPSLPVTTAGSSTPYTNTSNVNTTFAAANTSLLCNFTNAGIFDATAKNILETNGNAQASQTQAKFGVSSMYFDGTGDYLRLPATPNLSFGTGNFTVEFWVYFSDVSADRGFLGSAAAGGYDFLWRSSTGLNLGRVNTAFDNTFSWTPQTNSWYHVAYSRSGTSLRVFVDGTQVGTTATNSISYDAATASIIGGSTTADRFMNGYLDDFRITKGIARYTANFTPPAKTFSTQ